MAQKTVLIDFDGTLNSYKTALSVPEQLPDPPLPGAIAFLRRMAASSEYRPVILTSRALNINWPECTNGRVVQAVRDWLVKYGLEQGVADSIEITPLKVASSLIIDDSAWRFDGKYPTPSEMTALTKKKERK